MGETNFGILTSTSILKKLVGGDIIGFEKKGKDPFDEYNYAKILISSNSLPSSSDTSEGFYRRWLIIDFPNQFKEGKDILKDIPKEEYENLAKKVTEILPKLLNKGSFTNQGDIEERKQKYIMASNPLSLFIKKCCIKTDYSYVSYNELYVSYIKYLKIHKKRRIKMKEFKAALEEEGFWVEKTAKKIDDIFKNGYWIDGLELKLNWEKNMFDNFDFFDQYTTSPHAYENEVENQSKKSKKSKKLQVPQEIVVSNLIEWKDSLVVYHKCAIENCNETECNFDSYNVPYCKKHWNDMAQ